MSKRQTIMALGAWTMVASSLGFPPDVKWAILVLTGAIVAAVAYRLKPEAPKDRQNTDAQPYVDNRSSQ